jgi:hypothetical protein
MGPRALRTLVADGSLAGIILCGAVAVTYPFQAGAQVFTVGMKTATADVTTEFHPTRVDLPTEPLDEKGRQELIRDLESEQGFAHRELPLGTGLTLVANGAMTPKDEDYKKMLYEKGQSAAPGDRVQVTSLRFEANKMIIDFNGGPYAKHRFLSHIELNGMQLAQEGPLATGCRVTLLFEGGIPEVTAAEVKALLDPVVDFRAKTSVEAYTDTLPPKVREAVEAHEILVGMTRRMVIASMGEPKTKEREHKAATDDNSPVYEEWIYGETPQPIQFVRFQNGRVVRLEIAALGKPLEIHEKNETGEAAGPTLQTRTIANGDPQPSADGDVGKMKAPTLRKPGEVLDTGTTTAGMGKVKMPADSPNSPISPNSPSAQTLPSTPGSLPSGTPPPTTPSSPNSQTPTDTTKQQLTAQVSPL